MVAAIASATKCVFVLLLKSVHYLADVEELILYRYKDPTKHPRTIPPVPTENICKLGATDRFAVDVSHGKITVSTANGENVEIGDKLIYTDAKHPLK